MDEVSSSPRLIGRWTCWGMGAGPVEKLLLDSQPSFEASRVSDRQRGRTRQNKAGSRCRPTSLKTSKCIRARVQFRCEKKSNNTFFFFVSAILLYPPLLVECSPCPRPRATSPALAELRWRCLHGRPLVRLPECLSPVLAELRWRCLHGRPLVRLPGCLSPVRCTHALMAKVRASVFGGGSGYIPLFCVLLLIRCQLEIFNNNASSTLFCSGGRRSEEEEGESVRGDE